MPAAAATSRARHGRSATTSADRQAGGDDGLEDDPAARGQHAEAQGGPTACLELNRRPRAHATSADRSRRRPCGRPVPGVPGGPVLACRRSGPGRRGPTGLPPVRRQRRSVPPAQGMPLVMDVSAPSRPIRSKSLRRSPRPPGAPPRRSARPGGSPYPPHPIAYVAGFRSRFLRRSTGGSSGVRRRSDQADGEHGSSIAEGVQQPQLASRARPARAPPPPASAPPWPRSHR